MQMVTAPAVVATIVAMAAAGAYSFAEIGRVCGVARRTCSDIAKRNGVAARAQRATLMTVHHMRCAAAHSSRSLSSLHSSFVLFNNTHIVMLICLGVNEFGLGNVIARYQFVAPLPIPAADETR